jgi:uncharacterized protein (TIGR03067 family)
MQSFSVATFAVGLVIVFVAGDDEALKKEKAAIQGIWKVTSAESAKGKDQNAEGATIEFDKDGKSFVFEHNGQSKKGTFKLNPAGKPKELDMTFTDDNLTIEGIYQLDKDKFKACVALEPGDGRPSEFATKEGKNFLLVELERKK